VITGSKKIWSACYPQVHEWFFHLFYIIIYITHFYKDRHMLTVCHLYLVFINAAAGEGKERWSHGSNGNGVRGCRR
jgi:hypothetical protein